MSALKLKSILAEKKSSFSTDSNSVLSKHTTVEALLSPLIKASSCEKWITTINVVIQRRVNVVKNRLLQEGIWIVLIFGLRINSLAETL